MTDVNVVWVARDADVGELVDRCARGLIPFSGSDDSLWAEMNRRGRSTRYLFEAVVNRENELKHEAKRSQAARRVANVHDGKGSG